jgi:hypothetical protein
MMRERRSIKALTQSEQFRVAPDSSHALLTPRPVSLRVILDLPEC